MLPAYEDIWALAPGREPDWFDGNGVPRYAPFHPTLLGVYDRFAVLAEIECQGCRRRFRVGEGRKHHTFHWGRDDPFTWTLAGLAEGFVYGDPPRHYGPDGHGCVGNTMSSDPIRIIEAWSYDGWVWTRHPEHEIRLDD